MLRSNVARGGGGGIVDKMIPGYKDKIWAALPQGVKEYKVKSENDAFEGGIASHKKWQGVLLAYKETEKGFAPSAKFRKIAVDWRRQMERGTMHYGRWYEGPNGSDYRPGNTVDRLENVHAPFTEAEWAERKEYRSWDLMKFGYAGLGVFLLYRLTNEWPVVWCDDQGDDPLALRKELFEHGSLRGKFPKGHWTLVAPGYGRFKEAEPLVLEYFPLRGLGFLPQILLEVAGHPYKYHIMGYHYFQANSKPNLPMGRLPCVHTREGDGVVQSQAVVRYVAKACGLAGSDASELAMCDMLGEMWASEGKLTPDQIDKVLGSDKTLKDAPKMTDVSRMDVMKFDEATVGLMVLRFWEEHLTLSRGRGSGWLLGGVGDGKYTQLCYVDISMYLALRGKKEDLAKLGCTHLVRLIDDVEALEGFQRLSKSGRVMPSIGKDYAYVEDDWVKKP